jgi:pyridoxal phosphate enzyme (YggS family)
VSEPARASFKERLDQIEAAIAMACSRVHRSRAEVQLMAVSKTHRAQAVQEAIAAGVRLFGENRVQEFAQKALALAELGVTKSGYPATPSFHLIGHLQSNKAAKAAELFDAIDSLDSLRLAERLNEAALAQNRKLPVLLEIKLSHEESKTGLAPFSPELAALLERMPSFGGLELGGLMTVPPYSEDPEAARPYFRQLRELRDRLSQTHPRLSFKELSMGMSGDFAVAIEEGATVVRIGTALFGEREYPR